MDTIFGGIGNDNIFGGFGDDTINAGEGINTVYGDAGSDTYQFEQVVSTTFLKDFETADTLEFRYRDGVDDNSQSAVSINQVGSNTEVNLRSSINHPR